VRKDFIWDPSDHTHEEQLGKAITFLGPSLTTNVDIYHLSPDGLAREGHRKVQDDWAGGGGAVLVVQPIKFLRRRHFSAWMLDIYLTPESICRGLEGSFQLRKTPPATASEARQGTGGGVGWVSVLYPNCTLSFPSLVSAPEMIELFSRPHWT
jgi:hypothetical protein